MGIGNIKNDSEFFEAYFGEDAPRDFEKDLEESENTKYQSFWNLHYSLAFPNSPNRSYGTIAQKQGVDCIVYLPENSRKTIDEKLRFKIYPDIALEFRHAFYESYEAYKNGDAPIYHTKGWIEKELTCDGIAYAIFPADKVFWFNSKGLQLAWKNNKNEWLEKYDIKESHTKRNGRYWRSFNCCIPVHILGEAGAKYFITTKQLRS